MPIHERARPEVLVAFGHTVTLRELGAVAWRVTLSTPVLDATDAVAAAHELNVSAPEGMVYAMVTVEVTRLGEDPAPPWVDLSVEFVSAAGTTHTSGDTAAVAPAPSLLDLKTLYPGASGSGYVVIAIPRADAAAGTGSWTVSTMSGETTVFAARC